MEPSLPGIHLACAGGVAVIRINGRAAVERARDFDAAVRQMAVQGVREVHLALAGCPLLDSTFSGTLAGLAEASPDGKPLVQFVLHDARARIVDGLANLEVLPLLRVAPEGEVLICIAVAEA
jgi:anti-anti-sigma regulatory factor